MSSIPFYVRFTVRSYEIDTQGHLNASVYHQYAEHVRWECLRAAGIPIEKMLGSGLSGVQLECTFRFHRELRVGEEVDVSCAFVWGEGKTFRIIQEYRRPDSTLVAELTNVSGMFSLAERHLLPDPAERLRSLASAPEVLGL
jgi:acyl-CoA thioester hydrolase